MHARGWECLQHHRKHVQDWTRECHRDGQACSLSHDRAANERHPDVFTRCAWYLLVKVPFPFPSSGRETIAIFVGRTQQVQDKAMDIRQTQHLTVPPPIGTSGEMEINALE